MKKQFNIELRTKGAFQIEIARLDIDDDFDPEDMDIEDAEDCLSDRGDYVLGCAIGEDFSGNFDLKVSDGDEEVFSCNDFDKMGIRFEEDVVEDCGLAEEEVKLLDEKLDRLWKKYEPGMYLVAVHNMKWQSYSATVEDDEFIRLDFIANGMFRGLLFDSYTDPDHLLFNGKLLSMTDNDADEDEYGTRYYLVELGEDGWWDIVKEFDD